MTHLSVVDCRCASGDQDLRFCNPDALPELEFVSVQGSSWLSLYYQVNSSLTASFVGAGSDVLCDPMGDLPSVTSYEDSGGRWATRDAHHYACTEFDMEVFLLSLTIVHAPTQHNLLLAEVTLADHHFDFESILEHAMCTRAFHVEAMLAPARC